MDPWPIFFLMVGALGCPMACVMAETPEPVRRRPTTARISGTSLLRYRWRERRAFGWVLFVYTLFTYVTYGVLPWAPTLMTRKFALEPAQAGLMIGVVTLAGGIVGALEIGRAHV